MTVEKDFSHLSRFPGETGNSFDVVLHKAEALDQIPWFLFAPILLGVAVVFTGLNWPSAFGLWGFFLLDWLLVGLLPRFERSFGPVKPPVFLLAILRAIFALLPFPINLPLQILGTLLVAYSFWVEPHWLKVTHQQLQTPKLAQGNRIRILHLGDIHIERITRREREIQSQIDRLQPDLILFSGDILNLSYRDDPTAIQHAREVISRWQAPAGVYVVTGSPAVDIPKNVPKILDSLPIQWLKSQTVSIPLGADTIQLIGLTCTHRPHVDGPILKKLLPEPAEAFTILLYHTPDLAPAAEKLGVDLQLSGHTHGGQVRLPGYGALVTGSLYGKAFEAGRIQLQNMVLYVSRGIGMEGAAAPRLRFLCRPEMILWEITGSGPNRA
jgi:predicted MPP superfamily phosphohydrolase